MKPPAPLSKANDHKVRRAGRRADIVVRAMTTADLPSARMLWSDAEGVELAEGDTEAELAAYLLRNPKASQVACAGRKVVGAVLAGHDGRRGWVYHLAVEPAFRGRGIGREMITRVLAVLQRQGVRRTLILVARDNAPGRAFWIRSGWEPLDFAEPLGIDL